MVGYDSSLSAKAIHVSYTALPNGTSTCTQTCTQRRPWVLHIRQLLTMFDGIAYVKVKIRAAGTLYDGYHKEYDCTSGHNSQDHFPTVKVWLTFFSGLTCQNCTTRTATNDIYSFDQNVIVCEWL